MPFGGGIRAIQIAARDPSTWKLASQSTWTQLFRALGTMLPELETVELLMDIMVDAPPMGDSWWSQLLENIPASVKVIVMDGLVMDLPLTFNVLGQHLPHLRQLIVRSHCD